MADRVSRIDRVLEAELTRMGVWESFVADMEKNRRKFGVNRASRMALTKIDIRLADAYYPEVNGKVIARHSGDWVRSIEDEVREVEERKEVLEAAEQEERDEQEQKEADRRQRLCDQAELMRNAGEDKLERERVARGENLTGEDVRDGRGRPIGSKCIGANSKSKASMRVDGARVSSAVINSLMSRKCSKGAAIEWAYVHCSLTGVKPNDAPSMLAWSFLEDFRKFPSYKQDMMKSAVNKSMAKEEIDSVLGGDMDGQEEFNILRSMGGFG